MNILKGVLLKRCPSGHHMSGLVLSKKILDETIERIHSGNKTKGKEKEEEARKD